MGSQTVTVSPCLHERRPDAAMAGAVKRNDRGALTLADGMIVPGASDLTLNADGRVLARLAMALGAADIGGDLSDSERRLLEESRATFSIPSSSVDDLRHAIQAGHDPLGAWFLRMRSPVARRRTGAFYTPSALVEPMVDWVLSQDPDRLVDPGSGSGRFVACAVRRNRSLPVIAVDLDPLATILTRATLATLGAEAATVINGDYTTFDLPPIAGRTAFVGNPPYVRHHDLSPEAKAWAVAAGRQLGHDVSTLAGLHVHFFLATALRARPGDVGCFVTSAEWLDVNYGAIVRHLLLNGLGGRALHLIDPRAVPFEDAMTTAVITCFRVGAAPQSMRVRCVAQPEELRDLANGQEVSWSTLEQARRWTPLILEREAGSAPGDTVPLRTLARVHRGVVTGANSFFVLTRERARALGIEEWCRPALTSAEEILHSNGIVRDGPERRLLLDVPPDVDRGAHPRLDAYLRSGEASSDGKQPVAERYIPSHRRPWWYLGRTTPPPVVASYMARQAPVFALNPDGLAIINIAHGIYPTENLNPPQLADFVAALNAARDSFIGRGRTYHGGLEKFEPREMEALLVPIPNLRRRG